MCRVLVDPIKQIEDLMFMLGQYSKERFAWAKVGTTFSMAVLCTPNQAVVGALPMLELGVEMSGFTFPLQHVDLPIPLGKQWLRLGGRNQNDIAQPVGQFQLMEMTARLAVVRRTVRIREWGEAIEGNNWTE